MGADANASEHPTIRPAPPPGTEAGPVRRQRGLRKASTGFQAELREYYQARLRLGVGFLLVTGVLLWIVAQVTGARAVGNWPTFLASPVSLVHGGGTLAMAGLYALLRRRRLALRALALVDVAATLLMLATVVGIYVSGYERGILALSGFTALLLIARALVVPSTARRTLLLSLLAPLAILAVQLLEARGYAWYQTPFPDGVWPLRIVWDQVFLWLGVALAVMASRLNFALRLSAYEAKRLDEYTIDGLLGQGAMGQVYRAHHRVLRRPTAIKVLRADFSSPGLIRRFEHEVQQTCRLTHPNTIRVYDYGQTAEGVFYYAMELLDGADLDRVVTRTGPLSAARAIHVLRQVCGALHEAHEMGLVHRDVKAGNLLVCRQGLLHDVVKVMDFGLVKDLEGVEMGLTQMGELCGSPHTISPEAIRGEEVTRAADLYAVGAVAYYLLTGRHAFEGRSVVDVVMQHAQAEPDPPSHLRREVPADLERIVLHCLAKQPAARPPTAKAVGQALEACALAGRWDEDAAAAWWEAHGSALGAEPA